ncbi:MAG: glycosyltransferase family 4 protein [Methanophagales archaeon]|nr:glycosyltransferase family 4 protein [Methanophagales archaeon]
MKPQMWLSRILKVYLIAFKRMKIVMDFRKYDGVVGGVEQGVIELTRYVSGKGHHVIILCKKHRFNETEGIFEDCPNVTTIPLPCRSHSMSLKNAWLDSVTIQNIASQEGAGIIHFPYNWSFPFRKKVPSILTVHDVIPFTYREAMGFFRNHLLYRRGTREACRLNNLITTVSEYSKHELITKVGVSAERIRVIPNGIRELTEPDEEIEKNLKARFDLEFGFILNVGGIHERKNIVRLIHAFSKLVKEEGYRGKLVITGAVSSNPYLKKMKKRCDRAVKEAEMSDRVIFTGFIPDKELDTLLKHADLLVYPSLCEGFGMPVIEAMQAGTPVVTSNIGGTAEVAGDAAVLVSPYSIEDIAEGMSKLLHDASLREELKRKGKERAGAYSWTKTGEEYLELYKELSIEA